MKFLKHHELEHLAQQEPHRLSKHSAEYAQQDSQPMKSDLIVKSPLIKNGSAHVESQILLAMSYAVDEVCHKMHKTAGHVIFEHS